DAAVVRRAAGIGHCRARTFVEAVRGDEAGRALRLHVDKVKSRTEQEKARTCQKKSGPAGTNSRRHSVLMDGFGTARRAFEGDVARMLPPRQSHVVRGASRVNVERSGGCAARRLPGARVEQGDGDGTKSNCLYTGPTTYIG